MKPSEQNNDDDSTPALGRPMSGVCANGDTCYPPHALTARPREPLLLASLQLSAFRKNKNKHPSRPKIDALVHQRDGVNVEPEGGRADKNGYSKASKRTGGRPRLNIPCAAKREIYKDNARPVFYCVLRSVHPRVIEGSSRDKFI
ncbi:hypothetical protein EVAR_18717_1 [Eumeta japonica]|uniref:Uncharacterized protein n=1 Tax=Eumeta variegata TaxID=151549 RepID=A0A4C1UNW4_EUMVA|nr:hypothetical protein EVAR_18717_1 [Eumeta japonica]